ncbi:PT domain-containing protein [Streptomyces sp. NPDC059787]|uniref:PT domain-containing protein n=1 Tax=Streptomyces sp. NPDC059787 TaxID=3346947 RepID=UPI00364AF890
MPSLSHAARRGAACAAILIAALLTTSACGPDSPPNDSGDLSSYDYTEEPTDEPTEEPTDEPTEEATDEPTEEPTDEPTEEATEEFTEEPTEEPTELIEPVEASVPDSVVGVWCGGSNAEGHRTYEFSRTGEFMASRGSAGFSGVVVSDSRYMTFRVPGEPPFVSSWEVVQDPVLGPLLFLDGYSYLPGSCNS